MTQLLCPQMQARTPALPAPGLLHRTDHPIRMETLIIINPAAAKARRVWAIIQRDLNAAQFEFELYETKAPGDATEKTRSALRNGAKTIAVVGGDGTLSEAAEGFFEFKNDSELLPTPINPNANLAILPAGTGDDFARGLRGQRAPLTTWIDTLLLHRDLPGQEIDVLYGRCDGFDKPFICLNASTMG